jgi:hypothetical protein
MAQQYHRTCILHLNSRMHPRLWSASSLFELISTCYKFVCSLLNLNPSHVFASLNLYRTDGLGRAKHPTGVRTRIFLFASALTSFQVRSARWWSLPLHPRAPTALQHGGWRPSAALRPWGVPPRHQVLAIDRAQIHRVPQEGGDSELAKCISCAQWGS